MFVFHCGSCQFQGLLEWQEHPEEVAGQYERHCNWRDELAAFAQTEENLSAGLPPLLSLHLKHERMESQTQSMSG
jgi:hypothetical protein